MATKEKYTRHYEESTEINSSAESVFAYADDHRNFSSHMNKSSWMMGGGKMETTVDSGKGQKIGSHIRMNGTAFGVSLSLDEVIVEYEPPHRKAWETVGDVNLLVIDQYKLGFEITPNENASNLKVYIDYDLPKSWRTQFLGHIFGGMYAKWCVGQMANGTRQHFETLRAEK